MSENLGGDSGGGGGNSGGDGAGGAGAPVDFLTTLPADLRGEGSLKNFSGPDGHTRLAKSYTEMSRTLGSRSMADSAAPTDDIGKKAVLAKLGLAPPDGPDGYSLPDTQSGKNFRQIAHQHGLSAKAAESIFAAQNEAQTRDSDGRKQHIEARTKEMDEKIRSEWGSEYDANKDLANRATDHFLGKEVRELMEITGIINDPDMVKMFSLMGRALKEGTLMAGSGPSGSPATVEGFKAERAKIEKEIVEMKAQNKGRGDQTNLAYSELTKRRSEILTKEAMASVSGSDE